MICWPVNAEDGAETVKRITQRGGGAVFIETDVADEDDVAAMVEKAVSTYGSLDLAHNNAGISEPVTSTMEMSTEKWDRMIDINLRGVWLCMRAELEAMTDADGGAIVNTSSMASLSGAPHLPHYSAAKHGVNGLTKTAALEFAKRDIRVNAVCPGIVMTGLSEDEPIGVAGMVGVTPMDRAGQPEEVGDLAVFLCSDDASFITGVPIPVDGGPQEANWIKVG